MAGRKVAVIEPHKQWNNVTRKYYVVEKKRTFTLPYASFKESTRPGYSGNNLSKVKLLLFLTMAGPGRWFTLSELYQRLPMLKRSYFNRLFLLVKWKNVKVRYRIDQDNKKRHKLLEYSIGECQKLMDRLPSDLFNEYTAQIIEANPDLFSIEALRQPIKTDAPKVQGDKIVIPREIAERYDLMTRKPWEWIEKFPQEREEMQDPQYDYIARAWGDSFFVVSLRNPEYKIIQMEYLPNNCLLISKGNDVFLKQRWKEVRDKQNLN